jgi:hypothetical protein
MTTMSVQQVSVPSIADPALEGALARIEQQVGSLLDGIVPATQMQTRLVDEVGAGGRLDAESAVRRDSRFIIDSRHQLNTCGRVASEVLDLVHQHRRHLSLAPDLGVVRSQLAQHKLTAKLRDSAAHLSRTSEQINTRLAEADLMTQEARDFAQVMGNLHGTMAAAAGSIQYYDQSLSGRPQLQAVDTDPGSFAQRAREAGENEHGHSL